MYMYTEEQRSKCKTKISSYIIKWLKRQKYMPAIQVIQKIIMEF